LAKRDDQASSFEGPWTADTPREGIDDFWAVHDRALHEVHDRALESLRSHPELGPLLAQSSSELIAQQRAVWISVLHEARNGSWRPYCAYLRRRGAQYAEMGLTFHASSELIHALDRLLLRKLIDAYIAEPARLGAAIQAMNDLSQHAVGAIAEAYLERKEAELYAREEDLATTLDSIGDAVLVTDATGRIVRMNPVAERLTGFTLQDCQGQSLEAVFRIQHEDTGAVVESPVPRVLREGIVVGLANHTVLLARDGTRRPIADSGAPIRNARGEIRGVVLVFRDVTEERRAEEALRHWERIFQHANWGVALADVKEVKFQAVNPAYAAMHGYTVEELVGAPVSTLWAEGTRADMERHAHETHDHGHLVAETTHRRKDGTTIAVEVVATTIKDASGKIAWFVANVQDITERKRLQQSRVHAIELEARSQRIEEANRLKSEFLANMSHELRTPLNSIIGFAELLYDEQVGPVGPKQKEFLDDILTGGRHLLRLINDVLDLAKVEAGKMEFRPEPVDLGRLVGTVVQSLRAAAIEKRLDISASVDASLTGLVLDPGRFKQILYNYLSNALKFTPDAGKVSVRVIPEGDESFRLEVEDSGAGIAADQVGRLFVAFQQLETSAAKRHGGTGLGLALTRRLAEAQGGAVGVRHAERGGSIFFAILPRRHAVKAQAQGRGAFARGPNLATLLLVEPDQGSREALMSSLMDAGYEVQAVPSISQAMRVWQEHGWDAIVLAVDHAPDDSAAFLELVRARVGPRTTPVVAIGNAKLPLGGMMAETVASPVTASVLLAALARIGAPPPSHRPVLVVDDDTGSLRLMEATLANLGYEAVCFTDTHEALLALQRLRPAAVIIDVIMPDMDGLAFLERFRATGQNHDVPVMFWTVKDLSAEERRTLESRVELVVQKGVGDGSRLSAALQAFLSAASARKED
jgi:PAS domain S-box-containing protein